MVKKWLVRNDINFMFIPFEVEYQCVCLERMELFDVIMSTDGDCIILGAKRRIMPLILIILHSNYLIQTLNSNTKITTHYSDFT